MLILERNNFFVYRFGEVQVQFCDMDVLHCGEFGTFSVLII